MRTDLIVDLVKASVSGNQKAVRSVAEAIAADERAKRHTGVAERISKALNQTTSANANGKARVARSGESFNAVSRQDPIRPLDELYLDETVRSTCLELIEEQQRADVLRAHGLEPRHRMLLVGPPGNGKTSLAECIAFELGLPLLVVRYDAVVTSYLGETAQRLKRLFQQVRTEPCVLFFDEFDAIGKERGDLHETGEVKRVVTTLLLLLDELPSYCVLIGATNHPELLDRAAWRRFEVKLNLDHPTDEQLTHYFSDSLKQFNDKTGYTAKRLKSAIEPRSFSDAETFILDVKRRIALTQGASTLRTIIDDRVKSWSMRHKKELVGSINDKSPDSTST